MFKDVDAVFLLATRNVVLLLISLFCVVIYF